MAAAALHRPVRSSGIGVPDPVGDCVAPHASCVRGYARPADCPRTEEVDRVLTQLRLSAREFVAR